jgi:hypothetical protein
MAVLALLGYDHWESLVFLTHTVSFLYQLTPGLSFLFRTFFVARHLVAS